MDGNGMKRRGAGKVRPVLGKHPGVCEAELFLAPEALGGRGCADRLPLSPCSMNVQGDYEPLDATGFININSLR